MLFLIPIIAFMGFISGYLLKKYIPEEQKEAKPYLFLAEKILLSLLLFFLLYTSFSLSLFSLIFFCAGIVLGFFLQEIYLSLGIALLGLDFLPSVFVFILGLVKGEKHILKNALFFFPLRIYIQIPPAAKSVVYLEGRGRRSKRKGRKKKIAFLSMCFSPFTRPRINTNTEGKKSKPRSAIPRERYIS